MKLILLLLLLAACGKHEMPKEMDLNDSDGDQIIDGLEYSGIDKYIAKVVPLENIQIEMEFHQGESHLTKHTRTFSNKIDLQKYADDLLVRSLATIKTDEYFSEFSYMRISDKKTTPLVSGGMIAVTVRAPKTQVSPKSLVLILNNKKIELSSWSFHMEFELTSSQLNAVINGEAYLAATHLDIKSTVYNQTLEESIMKKTYRVLVNDGINTNIHYISKDLPFADLLRYLKIDSYKDIAEQNLLSTTYRPAKNEWWVRKINDRDIVLAKENLRELANHYLEGFEKSNLKLVRKNGKVLSPLSFKKHAAAKVLLKIRGEQNTVVFSERTATKTQIVIKGDSMTNVTCKNYFREASTVTNKMVDEVFLLSVLGMQIKGEKKDFISAADDEQGRFVEIKIHSDAEEFVLTLDGMPTDQYVQEGLYRSDCDRGSEPKIEPNLQVPERSLSLTIEAFVEKI